MNRKGIFVKFLATVLFVFVAQGVSEARPILRYIG